MPVKAFINLKNIVFNAKCIRKTLPENVKFCAVVKADAYGHGAETVSNALYKIADCFAVATVEEGVSLRLSGVDKEILVLTKTFDRELPTAADYSLTLTAGSLNDLKRYSREGRKRGEKIKVHLKYDTGMHRQGINGIAELDAALSYGCKNAFLNVCGLYSHFARPENEKSRKKAVEKFSVAKELAKGYNSSIVCHISASGGFLAGEYFDMVRIGILLYGYTPYATNAIKVKPAMKVYAPILLTRSLKRGDCALYGEKRANSDTDITLVRYGYADGLLRCEVKGQFNNRCMDVTALTGIKRGARKAAVMEDAAKTAALYGTIPYEVLVKCALRAEKIYKK